MADDYWLPIDSAPAEENVLLFSPAVRGLPALIHIGWAEDYPNRKPSHWMPLPAFPTDVARTAEAAE